MFNQITNPYILILASFFCGIFASLINLKVLKSTRNLALSISILPCVVCAALLAINGSLGTGIAILGVFGLVRFRSMPGSAMDILSVFYAMVIGLFCSTGNLINTVGLTVLIGIIICISSYFFTGKTEEYLIRILVPEDICHPELFEQIFKEYTKSYNFERIKTTNMGSMYELTYCIKVLPNLDFVKMIDDIRAENGNLNVYLNLLRNEAAL